MMISNWHALLFTGLAVSMALAIYLRPSNFIVSRPALLGICVMLAIAGLAGSKILFIILHQTYLTGSFRQSLSFRSGFAYFGALVSYIAVIYLYAKADGKKFLALMDYLSPFLMLSQAFVRVGCFLAGCCYGKPTNLCWGVRFKTVDNLLRHPTQIYEAVLFFAIYFVTRAVYKKDSRLSGRTFYTALLLYGSGRFFIEFFRVDSPALFMGITFAQYTCLLLAIITAIEIMPKNH